MRTFWILAGDRHVGLIRLEDPTDETPIFDLRIRQAWWGRGFGQGAVVWLTE